MPLPRQLVLIALLALVCTGCSSVQQSRQPQNSAENQTARNITEAEPSKSTPQPDAIRSLASYLGLKQDRHWQYLGEGNEYASFTADVTHIKGDLYQVEENNGGTTLARVIALRSDGAYEILTQGEHPTKQNLLDGLRDDAKNRPGKKLIPWPIRKDVSWTQPDGSKATVVATSIKRDVPFGELNEILQIRVESPKRTPGTAQGEPTLGSVPTPRTPNDETSYVDFFYAQGIGLVERNFTMGDTVVTSKLQRTTLTLE